MRVPIEYADYLIQDTRLPYKERGCPSGFMEKTAITVDGMKISRLCKRELQWHQSVSPS